MRTLKKIIICAACLIAVQGKAQSIDPVSLVVAKIIKAIDLKVQQMQNETLVLQGIEQAAQTALYKTKLAEIASWQNQLHELYAGYFSELKKVKSSISGAASIQKIFVLQKQVVLEYGRLGKNAQHKTQYDQLLDNSLEILQTLQMVLSSSLSLRDGERICVISTCKDAMQHCLNSIQSLNRQQLETIANQTRLQADLDYIKRLYGVK